MGEAVSAQPPSEHNYDYALPAEARTLDGSLYDPREDNWCIDCLGTSTQFNFGKLVQRGLHDSLVTAFKGVMMAKLAGHSVRSAHGLHAQFAAFFRFLTHQFTEASSITMGHLVAYRAIPSKSRLVASSNLHSAIRYWVRLGIHGVDQEALAYAVEAKKVTYDPARAVRVRCPMHGPYTQLEWEGLYKALLASFAAGRVDLENYTLCLLSGSIGPRPAQLADLKVGDYRSDQAAGKTVHILAMPRAKQRQQRARAEFKDRELVEDIAIVVGAQARAVLSIAATRGVNGAEAPLFPAMKQESQGILVHMTADMVSKRISETMEALKVRSERTGEIINVTPMRARRTVGTRAAQDGRPLPVIAEILDHSQFRTAKIYIETRMESLDRLDEKLAFYLAPLAQRFQGKVARRSQDDGDGSARHVLGVVQGGDAPENIGGCGKHSFCGLPKPLACYTCTLFQAWRDGPHEAVLAGLLAKRESQAQSGSLRVAEALDDTILAVAEVVRQCRAIMPPGEAASVA